MPHFVVNLKSSFQDVKTLCSRTGNVVHDAKTFFVQGWHNWNGVRFLCRSARAAQW
jgi:hypothetical protein